MNRATRRCEELARIHALRVVSTRLAANEVLQALHLLQDARKEREVELDALNAALADWHAALDAPGFSPVAVSAWGGAVTQRVARLVESETTVDALEAGLAATQDAHDRATAEEDCSGGLLRQARARAARLREERRLAERDDESARLGRVR